MAIPAVPATRDDAVMVSSETILKVEATTHPNQDVSPSSTLVVESEVSTLPAESEVSEYVTTKSKSTLDVLSTAMVLLKKITMLAASEVEVKELPKLLDQVYKTEILQDSRIPESISTEVRPLRRKNYKHKEFASFYSSNTEGQVKDTPSEVLETEKGELLASLRNQITATALKNDKLKAKANNLPIYKPRKKTNIKSIQSFYENRTIENPDLSNEIKERLQVELKQTLEVQISQLKSNLQDKIREEKILKDKLKSELGESLRDQLQSVLPNIVPYSRPVDKMLKDMNEDQLRDSLKDQLRALFQ